MLGTPHTSVYSLSKNQINLEKILKINNLAYMKKVSGEGAEGRKLQTINDSCLMAILFLM